MRTGGRSTGVARVALLMGFLGCVFSTYVLAPPNKWDVFVASGTGDGTYNPNKVVSIAANDDTTAQVFDHWKVEPLTYENRVADLQDPTTTFTTPASDPPPGGGGGNDIIVTAVYVSTGNSLFVDQTDTLIDGPAALKDSIGVSWGDHDDNGYVDFWAERQLWTNNEGTGFTSAQQVTFSGIWGDYDNDGDLDRFNSMAVVSGGNGARLERNDGGGTFSLQPFPQLQMVVGQETRTLSRSNGSCWTDLDNDARLDLYIGGFGYYDTTEELPDMVATNNGDGTFSVTWSEPPYTQIFSTYYYRMGRGVTSCDFDADGDQDVYVANYKLQPNFLWLNNGLGELTDEVAAERGVAGEAHSIGPAWGDFDNDGHFDLFVANLAHQGQEQSHFYQNSGPPGYTFTDRTSGSGMAYQESIANPALGDYDNDGDLDLFLTTVYASDEDHAVLYRNDGNWTFTDVTETVGLLHVHTTEQQAWADIDNDGDLDLVTDGRIFVNGGNSNHWLKLKLGGDAASVNRTAIGSQVRITLSGGSVVTRQVEGGMAEFNNQNDLTLHFGLGSDSGDVTLEIMWPGGSTCSPQTDLGVDRLYALTNPCGLDTDGDCICNMADNCHSTANLSQADSDGDGDGNVCDNCPGAWNPTQADSDGDGQGDACEGIMEICQSYCESEGILCQHAYYGPGGCCAYSCGPSGSCTGIDPLPPNLCQ
jgi:hypothetical protein